MQTQCCLSVVGAVWCCWRAVDCGCWLLVVHGSVMLTHPCCMITTASLSLSPSLCQRCFLLYLLRCLRSGATPAVAVMAAVTHVLWTARTAPASPPRYCMLMHTLSRATKSWARDAIAAAWRLTHTHPHPSICTCRIRPLSATLCATLSTVVP